VEEKHIKPETEPNTQGNNNNNNNNNNNYINRNLSCKCELINVKYNCLARIILIKIQLILVYVLNISYLFVC
jgi:hypothetical protein